MRGGVLISAGEASGDAHAAALVRAIRELEPGLNFFGLGGPKLAEAGVELLAEAKKLAAVGVTEALPVLGQAIQTLGRLKQALREARPLGVIVVDLPEINLRLAKAAKRLGLPVVYYIPPQVWAWRPGRVRLLEERTDQIIVIFPFEPDFYSAHGLEAFYSGHPFADLPPISPAETKAYLERLGLDLGRPVVGLLPGSRRNEISRLLAPLAEAARQLWRARPELQFLLPVAPGLDEEQMRPALDGLPVKMVEGQARQVLAASRAALVCSGTATLEAALTLTPMVVVYKASFISALIGRALIKGVKHIAMPNLIAGSPVVPELIQGQVSPRRLVEAISLLLDESEARRTMLEGLALVKERIGPPGASRRAAGKVLEVLGRG